jgi:hypothetical protein
MIQLCSNLRMNRREFCIVSGGALLGTSGCLEAGFEQGLRLGGVVLANQQASDIVVQLRIQQGDTTVVDSEYSLEPSDSSGSGITIDDAWSDRVDQYTVTVDLDDGMRDSFIFTGDHSHGDCTVAYIGIRPSTFHFSTHEASDGAFCSTTSNC